MNFLKRKSAADNILDPVKSSVKCITRGGTKVWGSITRKRKSASRCDANTASPQKVLHLSLTEYPKKTKIPDPLSSSLHSSISVTKSTDQKHYTCLSPLELFKITSQSKEVKSNSTPLKPPRRSRFKSPSDHYKLTYEEFKTSGKGSTPLRIIKRSQSLILRSSKIIDSKNEITSVLDFDILCSTFDGNEEMNDNLLKKDSSSRTELQLEEKEIMDEFTVESDGGRNEIISDVDCDATIDDHAEISSKLDNIISELKFAQGKTMFDRSTFQDIYDVEKIRPLNKYKDPVEELIKKKFIVNLYESPIRSKSLSSTPICRNRGRESSCDRRSPPKSGNKVTFLDEEPSIMSPVSCRKIDTFHDNSTPSIVAEGSIVLTDNDEEYDEVFLDSTINTDSFDILKRKRNQECSTIRGVSKAILMLRTNKKTVMSALLLAERELLLSTEKYRLYTDIMMNFKCDTQPSQTTATVTISRITMQLRSDIAQISNNRYFMCLLCSDIEVLATKYVRVQGQEGRQYIKFSDNLIFQGLVQNFKIHVKVYCFQSDLRRDTRVGIRKIFPKKTVAYPVRRYCYEDVLTKTTEENDFLLPIFKQCAVFEISDANFSKTNVYNYFPNSVIRESAAITKTISNLKMNVEMKGLLNFGQRYGKNELIIWNVKYVDLEEYEMMIYNSPSDDEPLVKIDLRNLASKLVTHTCHLKFCFQLDIVYDEDPDFDHAFKFPYFLRANTSSEFNIWSSKLNYVISRLRQWRMLPFLDRQISY